jgi:hypothetical protein
MGNIIVNSISSQYVVYIVGYHPHISQCPQAEGMQVAIFKSIKTGGGYSLSHKEGSLGMGYHIVIGLYHSFLRTLKHPPSPSSSPNLCGNFTNPFLLAMFSLFLSLLAHLFVCLFVC